MKTVGTQAVELVKEIAQTEQDALKHSAKRLKKVSKVAPAKRYKEGVDATRDVLNYQVKTQHKLGDDLVERLVGMEGFPPPAKAVTDSLRSIAEKVVDTQEDLTNSAADAMLNFSPGKARDAVAEAVKKPMDSAKSLMNRMTSMRDDLMKTVGKSTKKPVASVKKPAAKAKKAVSKKTTAAKTKARKTVKKASGTVKRKTPVRKSA